MTADSKLGQASSAAIAEWLVSRIAERRKVEHHSIDVRKRFSSNGVDSLGAMGLLAELSTELGRPFSSTLLWEYPTIEALARHLSGEGGVAPGEARQAPVASNEPIAIVGIACRFPGGASSPGAYWQLLRNGLDVITEVPKERWDLETFFSDDPAAPGKLSTRWGGFLNSVDGFDAPFFSIAPREAVQMDPQQRLMMELSWEALEDAGIGPSSLKDTATGVFFGAMWTDYGRLVTHDEKRIAQHTAVGQDLSIVAARVSYSLGLTGPSLAVNTACSSSLVAVHLARQSLLSGESRVALAGGVNLLLAPESTIAMTKFGAMAPDGRSKAFDARANGYVRGEGGGVVVLKRLSDALADGDTVYCVIRGSAVNNDGFSNGLTAPNPRAQEAVVRDACASAGVAPTDVQYVETHGTGTLLGDPIEAGALGAVLGVGRPEERPLRIGSVKTNIGHLEAAAGMAGLIKVALSMRHRTLPPSLHFEKPNPHIPFEALRLKVQSTLEPWEAEAGRLVAGVSSFGFGGTNSHVVLEATTLEEPRLFLLSSETEEGLKRRARRMVETLRSNDGRSLETVCAESVAAEFAPWRLSLVVRSLEELSRQLGDFAKGQASTDITVGHAQAARPRVAFMFGGHGSQWLGMGRTLLAEEPAARAVLEQCDEAFRKYVPWSLLERLKQSDAALFDQTDFVQPAIFAMQLAYSAVWRSRGVEPDAVIGQSMGEVAAACVAGALGLDDAARIICQRSKLIVDAARGGGMAVVGLSFEATTEALAPYDGRLVVAVSSGPETTVVAGEEAALQELLAALPARGVSCRQVRVDYASHSPQIDSLLPELRQLLAGVAPQHASTTFYSTVTAAPLGGEELNGAYWARNLREPVLFAQTVRRLASEGFEVFIEVDPHAVLTQVVEQTLAREGRQGRVVASARRDDGERKSLLAASGALVTAGVPLRLDAPAAEGITEPSARLVVLSAQSAAALDSQAAQLSAHLSANPELKLEDVAFSLATTRSALEHRLAISATSRAGLQAAMEAAGQGQTPPGAVRGRVAPTSLPKVVFVFPGQGSQWPGMGRKLLAEEPVFRAALEACDKAIQAEAGWSLLKELAADEGSSQLGRIDVVQPALFAMAVALAALWRSWGVEPDAVVGHSMGEVAAAYVAGALSLEDAVAIICRRSVLLRRISGQGEMALVELSLADAEAALVGYEDRLSVAVSNGPRSTVLSGEPAALGQVLSALEAKGVFCRRVKVDVASHSPQVEALREDLLAALASLKPQTATLAMRSTVTGATIAGPELLAGYWADNVRQPVRFAQAVQALLDEGHGLFVEMSPHPLLVPAVEEIRQSVERPGVAVGSLRRGQDELPELMESLGKLWVQGHPITWERLFAAGGRRVGLPTYPWQRQRYWIDAAANTPAARQGRGHAGGHPLLGVAQTVSTQAGLRLWETSLEQDRLPWLGDHRVQGAVVLAGAAYLEMALSCGSDALGTGPLQVSDVAFLQALAFADEGATPVQVVATEEQPGRLRFQVASQAGSRAAWTVHARGTVRKVEQGDAAEALDVDALRARLGASVSPETLYPALRTAGLEYGPAFQGMAEVWHRDGEALGRVRLPEAAGDASPYRMHPALLDACFQMVVACFADDDGSTPWVPVEVERLKLLRQPSGELWCRARVSRRGPTAAHQRRADLLIVDGRGATVAEVSGLVVQRLSSTGRGRVQDDVLLETDWERSDVPAPRLTAGRWLLLGEGGALGDALRTGLREAGHSVELAASDLGVEGVRGLLTTAFGGQAPTGVVHLGGLDTRNEMVEAALVRGYDSVLGTVQAITGMGFRDTPRLWIVTRGAQAVGQGKMALAQAPLIGLGRVIALEHAELRCARVDLDPAAPADEALALRAELLADDSEEEIALRGGARRVARLAHPVLESSRQEKVEPAGGRSFRLEIEQPGALERLVPRAMERRAPRAGEVELAVTVAGLGFLDVMKALGTAPRQGDGPVSLGGECAGQVVAVGEGVEGFQVGQEVVAVAPFSIGTHVTVDARRVVPRPGSLSAEQALPMAFLTAWYGLVQVGRLRKGERVLIHAAADDLGQAAVQVGRHVGAEVFVTAGTEAQRAWLREQGLMHVMDSHAPGLAAEVLAATGGDGVDIVLNSPSGEATDASLSALAPEGRFIEVGRRGNEVAGAHFQKSLTYSAIDLAGLAELRPARFGALLREVMDLMARGVFAPPSVERFSISRATSAFQKLEQARHLGKVVLTLDDANVDIHVPADRQALVRADGTYLVTGGLGGLGLSVAGWLAEKGAGHLVLVGRSGAASAEQQAAVAALRAKGPRVTVAKVDVADRAQLARLLDEVSSPEQPLRGVIHAAGLLVDGLLAQQSVERFREVMAPKVLGALHLHELTREAPLSFFVMYSSVAGLLGSPGQGNYAAANTFLDALAHHRRAEGLPALSIDWGAFSEVGLAAAQDNRGARLEARGMRNLTPDEGLAALARLLESNRAQSGVAPLNLRQWVAFNVAAATSPRLSRLLAAQRTQDTGAAGDSELLTRLASAEPAARAAILQDVIRKEVSQVLHIAEDRLDVEAPLTTLGMDSLMGLELRNRLEAALRITLPVAQLWKYPTVIALSRHLAADKRETPAPVTPPRPEVVDTNPSDAEIEAMAADLSEQLIDEAFEQLT
ncbi:SDR family NAD(P)-dependent oxidoreductase [Pyxidicoccus fallax]|uniref:SDR family NAD(P)-dependent oxidoreductase n=1 Tax=Pyxidicoccus fallax TaxID=394095 RepID=A0A848LJW3_9BACT|nr:type I polyketide synthase [Pyxidicoccus fallax]NMO18055.1 SDR family NAD(P)-dependent oxidoreductase [Pyxidicoccus fallax]NPC79682.1 SDR family NAD(P)-dependent oxidoreductase [Pyxidicoccus fallax]